MKKTTSSIRNFFTPAVLGHNLMLFFMWWGRLHQLFSDHALSLTTRIHRSFYAKGRMSFWYLTGFILVVLLIVPYLLLSFLMLSISISAQWFVILVWNRKTELKGQTAFSEPLSVLTQDYTLGGSENKRAEEAMSLEERELINKMSIPNEGSPLILSYQRLLNTELERAAREFESERDRLEHQKELERIEQGKWELKQYTAEWEVSKNNQMSHMELWEKTVQFELDKGRTKQEIEGLLLQVQDKDLQLKLRETLLDVERKQHQVNADGDRLDMREKEIELMFQEKGIELNRVQVEMLKQENEHVLNKMMMLEDRVQLTKELTLMEHKMLNAKNEVAYLNTWTRTRDHLIMSQVL